MCVHGDTRCMSAYINAIINIMCGVWYMQEHVHTNVTQRHMHTWALALFYVCALERSCVHAHWWIDVTVLFSNLIIYFACIQSCFMKQSEMFSKPFCTRQAGARKRGRYTHGNLCWVVQLVNGWRISVRQATVFYSTISYKIFNICFYKCTFKCTPGP